MPRRRKVSPDVLDGAIFESTAPEADATMNAVSVISQPYSKTPPLPLDWLVSAAQLSILGSQDLDDDRILSAASREVLRRIKEAEGFQITPREVILSLLRPALGAQGHCRCPSCRDRCAVCREASSRRSADVHEEPTDA